MAFHSPGSPGWEQQVRKLEERRRTRAMERLADVMDRERFPAGMGEADPLTPPLVAELLLALWDAPDREAGLAVVELPEALRDEAVITTAAGAKLIEFLRRNHCHVGGGKHRELRLERGWNVADLGDGSPSPAVVGTPVGPLGLGMVEVKKRAWAAVREALTEDVEDAIRLRVRLSRIGDAEASRMALLRNGRSAMGLLTELLPEYIHMPRVDDNPALPRALLFAAAHVCNAGIVDDHTLVNRLVRQGYTKPVSVEAVRRLAESFPDCLCKPGMRVALNHCDGLCKLLSERGCTQSDKGEWLLPNTPELTGAVVAHGRAANQDGRPHTPAEIARVAREAHDAAEIFRPAGWEGSPDARPPAEGSATETTPARRPVPTDLTDPANWPDNPGPTIGELSAGIDAGDESEVRELARLAAPLGDAVNTAAAPMQHWWDRLFPETPFTVERAIRWAIAERGLTYQQASSLSLPQVAGLLRETAQARLQTTNTTRPMATGEYMRPVRQSQQPRKATINARMIEVLQKRPEAAGWTISQWTIHLDCSRAGVADTPTWEGLTAAAKVQKADRSLSKRHRSKRRAN
jgi:hypothetical protein